MSPLAVSLLIIGAALEFVGIVAIAWPDLLPWKDRAALALRQATNRLRRLFGRPPLHRTISVSGAASIGLATSSAGIVTAPASGATIEREVAFLLERDQEAQRRENEFAKGLAALERRLDEALDAERRHTEAHVEARIATAAEQYRPLRVAGTVLIAAGLAAQVVANLV